MNLLILLLIWFAFPLVVIVAGAVRLHRLKKERLHDQILYRFCAVRDAIALRAASGELSEETEIFRFFYSANARLIHNHRRTGLCFDSFARHVLGKTQFGATKQPMSAQTKRLFRQLKHADEPTKQIALAWIEGCSAVLNEAARGMRFERAIWKTLRHSSDFYRWLGKQFYVPRLQRQTANFISGLKKAASTDYSGDPELVLA